MLDTIFLNSKSYNDVMSMHEECSIEFLDCRGYYDLAAEIIAVIVAIFILIRALGNYKELKE